MYGMKSERARRRLLAKVGVLEEERVDPISGPRRLEETAVDGTSSTVSDSSASEAGRAS